MYPCIGKLDSAIFLYFLNQTHPTGLLAPREGLPKKARLCKKLAGLVSFLLEESLLPLIGPDGVAESVDDAAPKLLIHHWNSRLKKLTGAVIGVLD